MSVDAVLDTNVLLYAASKDPTGRAKAEVGLRLLGTVDFGVPLQAVQDSSKTPAPRREWPSTPAIANWTW